MLGLTGYPAGTRVGLWSEAKFKITNKNKNFDYTFDYIAMPVKKRTLSSAAADCGMTVDVFVRIVSNSGYIMVTEAGTIWIEDFPYGVPTVIEIMTSSTSGSNKANGTTIADAFEHAILGTPHTSPSINKRQVWARMVSQLIVKSEVGEQWGGKTLWILQDNLVDYICQSTGLDVKLFATDQTSVVNIVSIGYGNAAAALSGVIELPDIQLYAGTVTPANTDEPSFSDIICAPMVPPLSSLFGLLAKKGAPLEYLTV